MKSTTRRVGITELAAEFHINRNVALKYLADAGVKRSSDKTFPYSTAATTIRNAKDLDKTIGNRTAGRAGGKLTANDLADQFDADVDPLDCTPSRPVQISAKASAMPEAEAARLSLVAARVDAEREKLRKLRFANDKAQGELMSRSNVSDTLATVVGKARTALLALGDRVAPQIVGEDDIDSIAATVNAEVIACLGELADAGKLAKAVLG